MSRAAFLAFAPLDPTGDGASADILAVNGADALKLAAACVRAGAPIDVDAPEGAGLHVWEGEITWPEAGQVDLDGGWRRATVDDLEQFGFPLSEAVAADPLPKFQAPDGFCCAMRRKFVPGVVAVDQALPVPTEFADFVLTWGSPTIFGIRFCPFCSAKIDHTQTLRVIEGT